jgi:hypothetical protein
MSQPAREFIVKIVELGLWSSDFITAHILLFILTPLTLIPYIDTIHATLLCKSSSLTQRGDTHHSFSLVASLQANSCTSLLHEGQEAEAVDCDQVRHHLPMYSWSDSRSGGDS